MKKFLTVLIAVLLILAIAAAAVGAWYKEKYAYSTEVYDRSEYFGVSGEECAIVLGNERIEYNALLRNGICYMKYSQIRELLNDGFYLDAEEDILLYTDVKGTTVVKIGDQVYTRDGAETDLSYTICFLEGEDYYLALDYVKLFTNFYYETFGDHMQLTTSFKEQETAEITKHTQIRLKGGIKSPVLREVEAGETVVVLEKMENWCKVKTNDAFIGYVENKRMTESSMTQQTPVMDYIEPERNDLNIGRKVSLGFHAIGGVGGNSTLDGMVSGTKGMNVIAPTWFSLNDDNGGFRNFGEASYVDRAHELGLQVWGVWDNFNYQNETGNSIDDLAVLSSTTKRTHLVQSIIATARELGLDGVNLDFEQLSSDCGKHYVQFMKELSVECQKNGLIFSVDNYMPNEGNRFYRLDVQGKFTDFVILMGYDEHWHGSKDPGSVASIGFVSQGIEKTLKSVPSRKVINALPFYTIVWRVDGAEVSDEYLTMNNMAEFLTSHDAEPVWDEITCQNYMEWTSGTQNFSVWLEDAESIRVKLNVMDANNLAGVAVWRLGFGTQAVWELLNLYTET